ncbi:hypothetical protein PT7_0294 [Pusillimonas sp. T7-7]|uniref:hypothetical protein n=1 Tax=Pusillimonas sp. (strain T7-7) TaxID=1007105 RepID=UPI0002084B05|nr:hypothetical protein [Pusillimonas sp. T7-7]AEC18834.1 hypothetical protein PT7_0294 [Pusillimonas sp. T7-7]
MEPTYAQFIEALEFMVSIEPDPELDVDYDGATAPYAKQIEQAEATIRAYGYVVAPGGLVKMRSFLSDLLYEQTTVKSESLIRSMVNRLWNGVGEWRG